jgi:hypothetical protein
MFLSQSWVRRSGLLAVAAAAGLAASSLVGPAPSASADPKGGKKGGGASGTLAPVAPADAIIALVKDLTAKAKKDIEDDQAEDAAIKFAVIAEVLKLQTLRDDADLKGWAEKAHKVYVPGANPDLGKDDGNEVLKNASKLVEDGVKNAKKWGAAKPASGAYTTANPNIKLMMSYVSKVNNDLKRAFGQPGQLGQDALKNQVGAAYALAEISNVTALFNAKADWKDWSVKQKDAAADIATNIGKGDFASARKSFDAMQKLCNDCHKEYQDKAGK